ncbi:MAG: hypothetical protein BWY09_01822 [Candidatus Hydrogenedentes bacterium ADurb.Bin179]|nr:MAG: hypothetical protein BWY09_01822 [Candidatus Hydrogenedentes bacterium ADurb.Bin179]
MTPWLPPLRLLLIILQKIFIDAQDIIIGHFPMALIQAYNGKFDVLKHIRMFVFNRHTFLLCFIRVIAPKFRAHIFPENQGGNQRTDTLHNTRLWVRLLFMFRFSGYLFPGAWVMPLLIVQQHDFMDIVRDELYFVAPAG